MKKVDIIPHKNPSWETPEMGKDLKVICGNGLFSKMSVLVSGRILII